MKFRLYHTPRLLRLFYRRDAIWQIPTNKKELFLTFDDGPTPEITQWILKLLEKYGVHATFFCVAENAMKYPDIFNDIKLKGHTIGNHTYNHLNGWETDDVTYAENIDKANEIIKSLLFRPPYGRIKRTQAKSLNRLNYKVVLWSILTYDFDRNLNRNKAWSQIQKHTKPGSILVFHDHQKAFENLKELLPKTLEYFSGQGFSFENLK